MQQPKKTECKGSGTAKTRINSTHKSTGDLEKIDLCGTWQFRRMGSDQSLSGKVPGCVHLDLLSAGLIEDPFYRDNELKVQWISEETWCYRRIVNVPEPFLSRRRVILIFEGLDTLAEIRLNGKKIGQTDNMYRRWEFDVKNLLQPGENTIEIIFASPVKYVREHQAKRAISGWSTEREVKGRGWIRKEPCNFGWDWGPILPTCGIWRPAYLEAFDEARILDLGITQTHNNGEVRLEMTAQIEKSHPCSCTARFSVTHEGQTVAETTTAFDGETAGASLTISNPKLWWPVNLGDQALYPVYVTVCNESGPAIDQAERRFGLRSLVVER